MTNITERRHASADQLIDAAAELLAKKNTLDVSISAIAKRAGLNSALIKYHFGNKEGLLLALLEREAAVAMRSLNHLVKMNISAEQKLKVHISGIINAYHRSPYLNRLIHFMIERANQVASKRVGTIFVEPMLESYGAIIAQGVREGSFRQVDPRFLYYSLVGACDHIFHASYSVPSTSGVPGITDEVRQSYIAHITQTFLHGLSEQSPGRRVAR